MTRQTIFTIRPSFAELREESVTLAPGPGEVLIRTTRTVVSNGTEGIVYAGNFAPGTHWHEWIHYPHRMGYLNCGIVEAVGEGVAGWAVGDRAASGGPHSSRIVVPASRIARVPDGVSDEEAAWAHLGLITQVGARVSQQALGDSVVIVGAGVLGQLVCQYSRLLGAKDIVVIDPAPARLALAREYGATLAIASGAEDAREAVFQLTQGRGADLVYDITGNAKALAPALSLARRYANVILLGDTGHTQDQHIAPNLIVSGLRLIGAHASHIPEHASEFQPWSMIRCYELFLHYLARRQMHVKGLISHRFKPAQAQEAYTHMLHERATTMAIVFDWD